MGQLGGLSPQGSVVVSLREQLVGARSFISTNARNAPSSVYLLDLSRLLYSRWASHCRESRTYWRMRKTQMIPAGPRTDDGDGRFVIATCLSVWDTWLTVLLHKLGMLMFIVSNLAGSTIQITTLPLPVLSTLQAV